MLKGVEAKSIATVLALIAIAILLLTMGKHILPASAKPLPAEAREAVDRECGGQQFEVLELNKAPRDYSSQASVKVKCADGKIITVSYGPIA